jgi:hypothetical protein
MRCNMAERAFHQALGRSRRLELPDLQLAPVRDEKKGRADGVCVRFVWLSACSNPSSKESLIPKSKASTVDAKSR